MGTLFVPCCPGYTDMCYSSVQLGWLPWCHQIHHTQCVRCSRGELSHCCVLLSAIMVELCVGVINKGTIIFNQEGGHLPLILWAVNFVLPPFYTWQKILEPLLAYAKKTGPWSNNPTSLINNDPLLEKNKVCLNGYSWGAGKVGSEYST